MAAPTPYDRFRNFQNQQALAPTAPLNGADVDEEYNRLKITTDAIIAALADVRRDDGALKNGIVTRDALAATLTVGFGVPRAWQSGLAFAVSDTTFYLGVFYACNVAHTSALATRPDTDTVTWSLIADFNTLGLAISDSSVTNAKLVNMTQATIKGRASGAGAGAPQDLTPAQAKAVLGVTLDDLTDVDLTTAPPSSGDGLVFDGTTWEPGPAGGGMFKGNNGTVGSRSGDIFRVNAQTLTSNVTIAATENALCAGPLTIDTGVTLTISSGGNLVIV